jgi:hypothetical protein
MKKIMHVSDDREVSVCDECGDHDSPYDEDSSTVGRCPICKRDICYKHLTYKPVFGEHNGYCSKCYTKGKELEVKYNEELAPINEAIKESNKVYASLNTKRVNLLIKYKDLIKNGS